MNIYFLSFRILYQLALALKKQLPWNFSLYWLYIVYHSGFLSNLRLPWKQSCPEIFNCIEYIFFIIQDFWATCACPANRVCPEFTVLNIYFLSFKIFEQLALTLKTVFALIFLKTGGRPPSPTPRLVRLCTHIHVAWTSNNRVIAARDLYCCLLPQCEALRTCRSGFPIATPPLSCLLISILSFLTPFSCFFFRGGMDF